MPLTSLPVTAADLEALQLGIGFFTDAAQATSEAAAINANTPNGPTVYSYAAQLLSSQISLSQVAMADSAYMEGTTVAAGSITAPATNTLALFTTQFLPPQVAYALAHGFNPTVFAAQSLGEALSTNAAFNTNYVSLTPAAFASAVATLTGLNANSIAGWLTNWLAFYTANAPTGATITQAAYGATFGDAIGTAILNPTPIGNGNLPAGLPSTTFNTIQNQVYNALKLNAEGTYVAGVAIGALPHETPLQGEAGSNGIFLTQNIDSPTSGFSTSASGTPLLNGFTASAAGQVFNALPFVTALGLGNNTLNTGDNLQTTGAATGTAILNYTTAAAFAANPPFAAGVTMNGVATANITNADTSAAPAGFTGSITGLLVENNTNSIAPVTLGETGQGLKTLLTNINISGNAVTPTPGVDNHVNTVILAAAAGDATKTISIGITGPLGSTAAENAAILAISNDLGGGTAASPNLTYGTWSITAANTANLQLDQSVTTGALGAIAAEGGVGGATALTLAGAGNYGLGQDAAGDWQLLKSIDETTTTGRVIVAGATAGNATNFLASAANPLWLFGSDAGLLDDTGAGFNLTSVKLGGGLDVLDISSATAAQVAALTTGPGTGVTVNPGNIIIVQDSVATTGSATTFKNIAGFSTLGIGGPTAAQGAAGTIDMANLPASIKTLLYLTQAAGSVTVNNGVNGLTVNVNHNTEAHTVTTLGINDASTTSTTDLATLILGDAVGTVGGITAGGAIAFGGVGPFFGGSINGLETTGYANVDIQSNGPTAGVNANILSANSQANVFTANPGALETLTITGSTELITNAIFVNGIGNTGVITDNDTAPLQIYAFGNNANFSPSVGRTFIATNAEVIKGAASGGVWMGGSDSFFNGATSAGDIITGSATASNVLAGSVGNDTITGGSGSDLIITDGGADTINLGATHTAATIDLFFGDFHGTNGGFNGTAAGTFTAVTGLASSITSAADIAAPGSWGVGAAVNAAGTPVGLGASNPFGLFLRTTAANNGTSADMSVVNGFNTGTNSVHFSVGAWGKGGTVHGLVNGDFVGGGTAVAAGAAGNVELVSAGSTVPVGTNVIELNGFFTGGANQVALALGNNIPNGGGSYDLHFQAAPTLATFNHFLVAYQTAPGGPTRIADVDLFNGVGAAGIDSTHDFVVASDMVQLTGVTHLTTGINANVHFVA